MMMVTVIMTMLLEFMLFHLAPAEDCLYEYTSHPMANLNCDPRGSMLQFHCTVTGPLNPHFQLQWLLSSSVTLTETRLDSLHNGIQIVNNILDQTGDMNPHLRSISSVLLTSAITKKYENKCFSCEVKFAEHDITLGSQDYKFCLNNFTALSNLPQCNATVVVFNSSSFCAENIPASLDQPTSPSSRENIPASLDQLTLPSSRENSLDQQTSPCVMESTQLNSPSLHEITPAQTVHGHLVTTAHRTVTSAVTSRPTDHQQSSGLEGELLAVIGICVVLIVIIVILLYIIIHLSRKKCTFFTKSGVTVDPNNSREHDEVAVVDHGYSVERGLIDSESLLSTGEEDTGSMLTTATSQHLYQKEEPVSRVPPKRWKEEPVVAIPRPSSLLSGSRLNSKSPPHVVNPLQSPGDHQQQDHEDSEVPPPVPCRTTSREHYYHTLEYTERDSLAISSQNSHCSNQALETMEEQLKHLFDDPRYAMMLVDSPQEGDLRGRKEIWGSAPMLATNRLTGRGGDRRSLRIPHAVETQLLCS